MRAHSRALNICASPVVLFLAAATFASEERVDPSGQKDQLDEVVVEGRRVAELRAEVIAAEDRMVALYNDLNTEPDLDI